MENRLTTLESAPKEVNDFEKWKIKRRNTTIIATIHIFLYGVEQFAIVTTLLYYLQNNVKVTNPELWFSIVLTAMVGSEASSGLIFGKYMDRTRNARSIMLFNLFISVIGNILYTFHYSVWFLIVGRILCGFSESIQSVMTGEFRRCYPDKELMSVLSKYQLSLTLGFIIGPCITLFKNINFTIGTWQITQYNSVGLLLASLSLIMLVVVYFGISDISKEYDAMTKKDKTIITDTGIEKSRDENEKLKSWFDFMQLDILLILVPYALARIVSTLGESVTVMILVSIFHWKLNVYIIVRCVSSLTMSVVLFTIRKCNYYEGGENKAYYLFVISVINAWIILIYLMLPSAIDMLNFKVQVVYYASFICLQSYNYFTISLLGKYFLLNLVPKHSASYMDGFRNAVTTFLRCIVLFLSSFVYLYSGYIIPFVCLLIFITVLILLFHRKMYIK